MGERTIIVFGGNGMLGRDVVASIRDTPSLKWEGFVPSHLDIDITNKEKLSNYLGKRKPWAVINTAAYTDVDGAQSPEGTSLAMGANYIGVRNLARICHTLGIILLHVSTDYVFSGQADGYAEMSRYDGEPCNIYGVSKKLGEIALREYCPRHYIVRTSWLMGAHGVNFVKTILKLAKKNSSIRVVNDQWGVPNYTNDVADKIITILSHGLEFGIYHPVSHGYCTWYDLAKAAIALRGYPCEVFPVPTSEFPRPAGRPERSILLNTKFPPGTFWDEGLKDLLARYPDLENE